METVERYIRTVHDFPKPGIVFKDIIPVLHQPKLFECIIDNMCEALKPHNPELLVGIEARGFFFTPVVAYKMGLGWLPARKEGKLPPPTLAHSYTLEYGYDILEMSDEIIEPGTRVALIDDVFATGGTVQAAVDLLCGLGADVVLALFLIELAGVPKAIAEWRTHHQALITFE
jgi:adenine phosphoribosyltransferase